MLNNVHARGRRSRISLITGVQKLNGLSTMIRRTSVLLESLHISLKMSITTKAYLGWLPLLGILTSDSLVKGTMSMMSIACSERENGAL